MKFLLRLFALSADLAPPALAWEPGAGTPAVRGTRRTQITAANVGQLVKVGIRTGDLEARQGGDGADQIPVHAAVCREQPDLLLAVQRGDRARSGTGARRNGASCRLHRAASITATLSRRHPLGGCAPAGAACHSRIFGHNDARVIALDAGQACLRGFRHRRRSAVLGKTAAWPGEFQITRRRWSAAASSWLARRSPTIERRRAARHGAPMTPAPASRAGRSIRCA